MQLMVSLSPGKKGERLECEGHCGDSDFGDREVQVEDEIGRRRIPWRTSRIES
jgi:hypothetical protein